MAIDYSQRPKGTSKREWWAQQTGGSKYDYPGESSSKSSSGSSSISIPKLDTSQIRALQEEYEKTLVPTESETATSTALENLLASQGLGEAKIESQPIASDFTRGQVAGLTKQTLAKAVPLEQKLARLQAQRQSAADVLKSRLGVESGILGLQQQQGQFGASLGLQQQQLQQGSQQFGQTFAEQQRQFDENLALQRQQEARLAGQASSSSDILSAIIALQNQGQSSLPPGAIPGVNYSQWIP